MLEITGERTRFVPVVNATRLAMMGICASVCIVWMLTRAFRKRKWRGGPRIVAAGQGGDTCWHRGKRQGVTTMATENGTLD